MEFGLRKVQFTIQQKIFVINCLAKLVETSKICCTRRQIIPYVNDSIAKKLFLLLLEHSCLFMTYSWPGLELPPGMPGISPALVSLVPCTAVAKAIPAGDTVYPRLCETVSDNYGKSY